MKNKIYKYNVIRIDEIHNLLTFREIIDIDIKSFSSYTINYRYIQTAEEILKQLRDILGRGAKMLLENEKIEGEELKELLAESRDYFSKEHESTNASI